MFHSADHAPKENQIILTSRCGNKNPVSSSIIIRKLSVDAIIRIKLEGIDDYETVNLLSRHKLNDRNWRPTLRTAETYEKTFSIFDRAYNKVIPFKELWNINDIKYLFEDLRSRAMTQDEQRRIEHNININLELLHTLRNNA